MPTPAWRRLFEGPEDAGSRRRPYQDAGGWEKDLRDRQLEAGPMVDQSPVTVRLTRTELGEIVGLLRGSGSNFARQIADRLERQMDL